MKLIDSPVSTRGRSLVAGRGSSYSKVATSSACTSTSTTKVNSNDVNTVLIDVRPSVIFRLNTRFSALKPDCHTAVIARRVVTFFSIYQSVYTTFTWQIRTVSRIVITLRELHCTERCHSDFFLPKLPIKKFPYKDFVMMISKSGRYRPIIMLLHVYLWCCTHKEQHIVSTNVT